MNTGGETKNELNFVRKVTLLSTYASMLDTLGEIMSKIDLPNNDGAKLMEAHYNDTLIGASDGSLVWHQSSGLYVVCSQSMHTIDEQIICGGKIPKSNTMILLTIELFNMFLHICIQYADKGFKYWKVIVNIDFNEVSVYLTEKNSKKV